MWKTAGNYANSIRNLGNGFILFKASKYSFCTFWKTVKQKTFIFKRAIGVSLRGPMDKAPAS